MAEWKSRAHLEDHFEDHHRELRVRSIEEYDASAQETIAIGVQFTFRHHRTGLRRIGYFHRESSRMTVVDLDGYVVSHFQTDEAYVAGQDLSIYQD